MPRINRFAVILLVVLIAPAAMGQRNTSDSREARVHGRTAVAIDGLKVDLRDARKLLAGIEDRRLRDQLELLLSRAALKAEDLEELLGGSPRRRAKLPMSDADFAKLLENLKDQSFDEQKLEFVETFVKGRPLNCDQATKLLKTFSFDEDRSKAAVILYWGLVDSDNFFEVLKVFPFESSRKKVMEAVRKR